MGWKTPHEPILCEPEQASITNPNRYWYCETCRASFATNSETRRASTKRDFDGESWGGKHPMNEFFASLNRRALRSLTVFRMARLVEHLPYEMPIASLRASRNPASLNRRAPEMPLLKTNKIIYGLECEVYAEKKAQCTPVHEHFFSRKPKQSEL